MYCHGCQYDLRGLTESRCPECGRPFNPHDDFTYLTTPHPPTNAWPWFLLSFLAAPFAGVLCRQWLASFFAGDFGIF